MRDTAKLTVTEEGFPLVERKQPTFLDKAKYYGSLLLGLTATVDAFLFIFLVPFVIDPSISFFLHKFNSTPGTCIVASAERVFGQSNISWSSCREGCTVTQHECTQIVVNYTRQPPDNMSLLMENETLTEYGWEEYNVQLLINNKGCGYPPHVQCWKFNQDYAKVGLTFPCYYSTVLPSVVITRYEYEESLIGLIICTVVPVVVFLVCIIWLSCCYCSCGRSQPLRDDVDDDVYDNVSMMELTPMSPEVKEPILPHPEDAKPEPTNFETHNGATTGGRRHSIEIDKCYRPLLAPIEKHRRTISTV